VRRDDQARSPIRREIVKSPERRVAASRRGSKKKGDGEKRDVSRLEMVKVSRGE
jgi:hypothetical protein